MADITVIASTAEIADLAREIAGGPFDRRFNADWWRQAVVLLLERAAGLGIPVAVENGPDPVKSDVRLLAAILGHFASPWLRLTFDTGNWLYVGVAPEEALSALAPFVGCVHLKDIVDGGDGLKHSPPGDGVVDVRGLAKRLTAGGYDGPMILEFPGR